MGFYGQKNNKCHCAPGDGLGSGLTCTAHYGTGQILRLNCDTVTTTPAPSTNMKADCSFVEKGNKVCAYWGSNNEHAAEVGEAGVDYSAWTTELKNACFERVIASDKCGYTSLFGEKDGKCYCSTQHGKGSEWGNGGSFCIIGHGNLDGHLLQLDGCKWKADG